MRSVRKLYLITYSQADVVRFPPRQSFVQAVLYSFYDTPDKSCTGPAARKNGRTESGGSYFQMALKLNRNKQRLPSKRFLLERCGISFHFSGIHRNYFSAWKYLTKQDKEFVESPGYPDLSDGLPKTTKESFANKPHSTGSQDAESVPPDSTDCNKENSQGRGQKNNINSNHKKQMSSYERAEL